MNRIIEKIFTYGLIILGLIIVYQIMRKVFGGSWIAESIIIILVMFNLGMTYKISNRLTKVEIKIARIESDLKHLNAQFSSLARDFKEYIHK